MTGDRPTRFIRRDDYKANEPCGGTVEKCLNCQFYDRRNARPNDGRTPMMWGQCRRHSPHLNPLGSTSKKAHIVEGVWPLVRDDDWCGEWRAPMRASTARVRLVSRAVEATASTAATTEDAAPADKQPAALEE